VLIIITFCHTSLSPIATGFVIYKKDALDSHPQVIQLISCFPTVGASFRGVVHVLFVESILVAMTAGMVVNTEADFPFPLS
jgi:hypothetical protein